ncbi:MAG: vitamin B12-dependent ribonucleotide reductase [Clostridiaceae bacterium]|jgi:ribonucleoside-diphosphate reductase alpha chain|nr:vitamin B12-dependent ribonucleotide reductase [Clostridiaceae bacterium]
MNLTENALKVLERRYLAKNENGELIETPELMFKRVAKTVAMADKDYVDKKELAAIEKKFYNLMSQLYFLPNSPTLMNAGRPLGQLSACFVLPIEDSMEGIFDSVKNAALIHKSGGGTGFSFSRLRGKGSSVNSTGGVASGPVSFMKVFNAATEAVKQGGTRRGANMGILRVDHPDILEFITCKQDNEDITNFNISVGITEAFMKAVEDGSDYDLIEPRTKKKVGTLNAPKVFNMMVEMAWKNGEPGIVFLDRLNKDNITPELGEIESTNPCGEQPLLPYESCNLGSINLSLMLKETDNGLEIDFDKLKEVVHDAVHFLDNVIDVNKYPLPEIDKMTRGTRKIGLGVMGWADMLLKLKIPYDSNQAIDLAEEVMSFIQNEAREKSIEIAKIKGVFPYYDKSIYKDKKIKIRNATTTTIAPTGTLSIIAGVSSGVEPLFAISYIKNVMDNDELVETNPIFEKVAKVEGFYSEELMKKIAKSGGLHGIDEVSDHIHSVFVTSHDITPEWHVKMQAAFQKYTDNAVSKTVNLKNEATVDDVREVFIAAYKTGCKGVTIYRDGSRGSQVLNIGKVNTNEESTQGKLSITPRPRPDITNGFTEKVKTGCGNLYITVNYDENGICEVFTNTGRAGGCPSQSEATARLVSIALRSGMDAESIIEQMKGIRCPSTIRQRGMKVLSCPDAIGRLIEKVMIHQNGNGKSMNKEDIKLNSFSSQTQPVMASIKKPGIRGERDKRNYYNDNCCPECGEPVEHEGGCKICRSCGYSKCG